MKMKGFYQLIALIGLLLLLTRSARAAENLGPGKTRQQHMRTTANCLPSSASAQLDINNVRCLLHNGGDMWWDLTGSPRYEIPKVDDPALARHSAFAASLWIGGIDDDQNLRVAAQTYRQSGNDFFPGPLTRTGGVTQDVCNEWDKMFKINKTEIDDFRAAWSAAANGGAPLIMSNFPAVASWPAFGYNSDGRVSLAPFVDVDGDPEKYTPQEGDYPDIRPIDGGGEPDQAIWWVINDKGDVHTETGGLAIGLEIQMMAFAFSTSNAINDMTFYKYKVINKSGQNLHETYMGQWADVDLGYAKDDFVGCDTVRGLGYSYNADPDDESNLGGYGEHPPVFGIDFFQGPLDTNGKRLGMTQFMYYDNKDGLTGNPEVATHYYGYLRGFWKDGSRVTAGGNGLHGATPVNYMFPGDPGACGAASGWNELSEGNPADDRRFILSAGPFFLQNGAQNEIITGAVWAQGNSNGQLGSLCEAFSADDLAQALFDAKFHLLDGPDAPNVAIGEFDQELVLSWDYLDTISSNNFQERYSQVDPALASQGVSDPEFQFQGYMVFQLKDGGVSNSDLFDTDKARLLAQCDVRDGVGTIVNRVETFIQGLDDTIVTDQVMVTGADAGIFHSVIATEDLFAEGSDRRLRNYTNYYYAVIAYAWNGIPSDGRKFVQGNGNFENVTAMPHKIGFEAGGTVLASNYGDGLPVDQINGIGNGGHPVILRPESETEILRNNRVDRIGYAAGASPIQLRVVNAKEVQKGDYRVEVVRVEPLGLPKTVHDLPQGDVTEQERVDWKLYHNGDLVYQSRYIERLDSHGTSLGFRPEPLSGSEHVIPGHGFAIGVYDPEVPALTRPAYDPVIAARLQYADPSQEWLSGYSDIDREPIADWIMAGIDTFDRGENLQLMRDAKIYDPEENFERLFEGSWAPMCLARSFNVNDESGRISPGINVGVGAISFAMKPDSMLNLAELPDIDLVISPDPAKWSRCVVVETSPNNATGAGSNTMTAKWKVGLDEQLQPMQGPLDSATQGWSMFPGYAVDVNTGQRLNIFFGENDWDKVNHGGDMLWNPTAAYGSSGTTAGGRHYIYVSKTPYDGCAEIHKVLARGTKQLTGSQMLFELGFGLPWENPSYIANVYRDVAWVGVPMVREEFQWETYDQIPTETRLSLRINHPYHSRPGSGDYPVFLFNTDAFAAATNVAPVAQASFLQDVRVVPNPYYGFSDYEGAPTQTIVKITNLPRRCNIKIFNLSGTLVRSYAKNSDSPEQTWDLKNQAGVPIASGAYLIHVDGFELGETIVKLFTVMPQMDLSTY
jgi:hypothetical protein